VRIIVFSWRDLSNPRAGGAERVTFHHMRSWVRSGHQVTLFTALYPQASARDLVDGVRIVRSGSELTVHIAAQHWYRRQPKPDLVVDEIHGVPFGLPAYAGVPVLAWIYEVARGIWNVMYPLPVAVAGQLLESRALRWYAKARVPFVADSASTASDLRSFGVEASSITVIEPGIDHEPLARLPEKASVPTLIYVGRLVRMKGIEDAICALALIRHQVSCCRLWVVGAGDPTYLRRLEQLTSDLGLREAVQFLGRVTDEEKQERLRRAHLLIHPSLREGWGINVIEANAMGTPAIGYLVHGLRDSIVDGQTGLLCPGGRPESLAAAVIYLLQTPDFYRSLQNSALKWSRRFTWPAATSRSLALLDAIQAGPDDKGSQYA
jgi:glycosyltransferase involved in cell wall biosynthesis